MRDALNDVAGVVHDENGHGFALHSAANAAAELGGRLEVASDGVERGACFTLKRRG